MYIYIYIYTQISNAKEAKADSGKHPRKTRGVTVIKTHYQLKTIQTANTSEFKSN